MKITATITITAQQNREATELINKYLSSAPDIETTKSLSDKMNNIFCGDKLKANVFIASFLVKVRNQGGKA